MLYICVAVLFSVKFLFLMNKCSVVQMLGYMLVLFVCANVCGQLCHSALVDARGQLWGVSALLPCVRGTNSVC